MLVSTLQGLRLRVSDDASPVPIAPSPEGTYDIIASLADSGSGSVKVIATENNMDMCNCASAAAAEVLGCPYQNPCDEVPTNAPAS